MTKPSVLNEESRQKIAEKLQELCRVGLPRRLEVMQAHLEGLFTATAFGDEAKRTQTTQDYLRLSSCFAAAALMEAKVDFDGNEPRLYNAQEIITMMSDFANSMRLQPFSDDKDMRNTAKNVLYNIERVAQTNEAREDNAVIGPFAANTLLYMAARMAMSYEDLQPKMSYGGPMAAKTGAVATYALSK